MQIISLHVDMKLSKIDKKHWEKYIFGTDLHITGVMSNINSNYKHTC